MPVVLVGLALAVTASVAQGVGFLCQQVKAWERPPVSLRRPVATLASMLRSRWWRLGLLFAVTGFLLHLGALALAPISLVQAFVAGGLALVAPIAARVFHHRLTPAERRAVPLMALSLAALALGIASPARPLEFAGLKHADGSPADPALFTGKWTLIYVGDGACDPDCRQALVFGRQSRLALNNEMTRVQRVFLATGNCCAQDYFSAEQPGLIALDASGAQALLAQFPANRQGSLFIVDPLGNLMMRHEAAGTSKALLTDLKKLLKLSHIG